MIRIWVVFVTLFAFTKTFAQGINGGSENSIVTFEAGITNFRPFQLNDLAHIPGTGFTELRTYGLGLIATAHTNRSGVYDGALALHIFEPNRLDSFTSGSSLKVSGWELMTSMYGFDILRGSRVIDITIAPGVFWGALRLKEEKYQGNEQRMLYKNPFVAPALRGEVRLNLGPITVGGRISYRFDITSSKWKRRDDHLNPLPGYRFREWQYVVYLGWRFREE